MLGLKNKKILNFQLGPSSMGDFIYWFWGSLCVSVLVSNLFHIVCSVGVHTVSELKEMVERMGSSQLQTYNLTENDLVKDHLRYLVILFS